MPTRTRDEEIAHLRALLSPERSAERRRKMTPEQREIFESVIRLRDEVGLIDFDVVQALRELRNGG